MLASNLCVCILACLLSAERLVRLLTTVWQQEHSGACSTQAIARSSVML
jgi:hypothetical protein